MRLLFLPIAVSLMAGCANRGLNHDFGRVTPDAKLSRSWVVRNTSEGTWILSGFDKACGLSANLSGNPVLLPGQSATLTLSTTVGWKPGPQGAFFNLLIREGPATPFVKRYEFTWTTVAPTHVTPAAIVFEKGRADRRELDIGPQRTIRPTIRGLSNGVTAQQTGDGIVIVYDGIGPPTEIDARILIGDSDIAVPIRISEPNNVCATPHRPAVGPTRAARIDTNGTFDVCVASPGLRVRANNKRAVIIEAVPEQAHNGKGFVKFLAADGTVLSMITVTVREDL